jgi:hypothetical protein
MKTLHYRICLLLTASILALSGCGGDSPAGNPTNPPPAPPTSSTTSGDIPKAIAPVITEHPLDASVLEGASATFSVSISGTESVTYQWRRDGTAIPNATGSSYTLADASLSDNGVAISVAIKGVGGTTNSTSAKLTVSSKGPSILTQPSAVSIETGKEASFSVTASGQAPLAYQWSRDGVPIAGAQSAVYKTTVSFEDNGAAFSVKVSNAITTITSGPATLTVLPSVLKNLVISEVSGCAPQDVSPVSCWFEVYNPTGAPIDLSKFLVRSSGWDLSTKQPVPDMTFPLPPLMVPNGGYVIVSGNPDNFIQVGKQNAYIRFANTIPHWTQSGFVELILIGSSEDRRSTVDFVPFGSSTQQPTTADQWSGPLAAALSFGPTEFGKSIARLFPGTTNTDTNTASDWTSVSWATPAGRNDVLANAVDVDGDGIPDSAEVAGGTFGGIDLYAMGARTNQKDLFIEVDHMEPLVTRTNANGETVTEIDHGIVPRAEALQKVAAAFDRRGIKVWFDAGTLFSPIFSLQNFNLGQSTHLVPYEKCVSDDPLACTSNTSTNRTIYDWKNQFMNLTRRPIFHYMLFGDTQNDNGSASSSGLAELVGNDLLITMGNWGFCTCDAKAIDLLINQQAATIMHELGHNLGLQHGGDTDTNYKPNYWSVMNYLYQLNGLDPDASSITAYQRWLLEKGDPTRLGVSDLVGSPNKAQGQFVINYSSGTSADLDENKLLESNNVGRGNADNTSYADWDLSFSLTGGELKIDLNQDGVFEVLNDYSDWGNLVFPFFRHKDGNSGASLTKSNKRIINPMVNDRQPVVKEMAPSSKILQRIRQISTP